MFQAFNTETEAPTEGTLRVEDARRLVTGLDVSVPVYDGSRRPYVNVDNAATTPAFVPVVDCVTQFQRHYSSVHRGTGFKSLLSTHVYEQACRQHADMPHVLLLRGGCEEIVHGWATDEVAGRSGL